MDSVDSSDHPGAVPVVTEKVLPYDRAIVPQERGWWCGPASCQVVLNSRGILVSEYDMMLELEALEHSPGWDDNDGTAHEYVTVWIQAAMPHMNAEVNIVPATETGAVAGMSVRKRTGSHVLDSDADTPERVAEVHARALDRLDHYVIVQPEPEPGEE